MQLTSIQQKITLWVGLCLFLAFGSFWAYSTTSSRNRALEEAQARALENTQLEAARLKAQLDRAGDASRHLAQTLKATKDANHPLPLTRDNVNVLLRKLVEENPQFLGVFVAWEPQAFDGRDSQFVNTAGHDQTGRFVPLWLRNTRDELLQEPLQGYADKDALGELYQAAKRTQKEVTVGPLSYSVQGKPVWLTAQTVPLVVDGKFLGVAGVLVPLEFVQSLLNRLTLYEGRSKFLLVNQDGLIVGAARQPEFAAKALRGTDPEFEKYLLAIRTGRDVVKFSGTSLKVMVPVKLGQSELPWAACLTVPVKELTGSLNQHFLRQFVIGLCLMALSLCFLWYLAGQLAQPIKQAAEFANQLAHGIMAKKVPVGSADETGQLLAAMNRMLESNSSLVQSREERDRLQRSIIKLLEQVSSVAEGDLTREAEVTNDATGAIADSFNFMLAELRRIIGEVKQVADEVTVSAQQTQQTTQQLAEDARARSEEIIHASQEIDAMAVSIRQVAASADTSRAVAHQSLATAKRGSRVLQNTMGQMQNLREQVQETAKRIKRLGEHSQEIGEIVQLISDIAYRTSVLALNASIQAARAGEAGRGFAVVAEDVERLAKRSSEATRRIAELVKTTQMGAKEAIAAMEESTQEVVMGTHLIQEAGTALVEIEAVSTQLAELVQGISEAAEAQRQESEEVSRRMVELSEATAQTAQGIKQSAGSVKELAALASDLNGSVGSFKLLHSRPASIGRDFRRYSSASG